MRHDPAPSWAEAAAQADFPVFTVATPSPDRSTAGGFGFSGDDPVSLEVIVTIGEARVSIDSHLLSHAPPERLRMRILVHDLLTAVVPFDEAPLTLPLSLEVNKEDRVISVDGHSFTFTGARLGDSWAGTAEVDEKVWLRIVENGPAGLSAITVLRNRALPEHHLA